MSSPGGWGEGRESRPYQGRTVITTSGYRRTSCYHHPDQCSTSPARALPDSSRLLVLNSSGFSSSLNTPVTCTCLLTIHLGRVAYHYLRTAAFPSKSTSMRAGTASCPVESGFVLHQHASHPRPHRRVGLPFGSGLSSAVGLLVPPKPHCSTGFNFMMLIN